MENIAGYAIIGIGILISLNIIQKIWTYQYGSIEEKMEKLRDKFHERKHSKTEK